MYHREPLDANWDYSADTHVCILAVIFTFEESIVRYSSEFSALLDQCRSSFGPSPRQFSARDYKAYLRSTPPFWCLLGDDLMQFFKHQRYLLEEGDIVWGHVVQANSQLFQAGDSNCPGEVVYCTDPTRDVDLEKLSSIAMHLYGLKGKRAEDASQQYIGNYLANERKRVFGFPVPPSISPLLPCAISTVFFNRNHLPDKRLSNSFFPTLISRIQPRTAMVLPSRHWPQLFTQFWQEA